MWTIHFPTCISDVVSKVDETGREGKGQSKTIAYRSALCN